MKPHIQLLVCKRILRISSTPLASTEKTVEMDLLNQKLHLILIVTYVALGVIE